jgi:predicted component of type VI protein secretion system
MVTPLYLKELDRFAPCDTVLLIHDLDRILGVRGRYRELLATMMAVPTGMPRSHISQGWQMVQCSEMLIFVSF